VNKNRFPDDPFKLHIAVHDVHFSPFLFWPVDWFERLDAHCSINKEPLVAVIAIGLDIGIFKRLLALRIVDSFPQVFLDWHLFLVILDFVAFGLLVLLVLSFLVDGILVLSSQIYIFELENAIHSVGGGL
jgi:hypothetical protein